MRLTSILLAALLLVFLTQTVTAETDQCPPNYLEVADRFLMGLDDELIPTFAYMHSKIGQLEPVEYKTQTAEYRLFDIRPFLVYEPQLQNFTVIGNNVSVYNGMLVAKIDFSWVKNNDTSQIYKATASGRSHRRPGYVKQIYSQNSTSLRYRLLSVSDINWQPVFYPWKLSNLVPDNITQEDQYVLLSIACCWGQFCKQNQKKAFRIQLEKAVNSILFQELNVTVSSRNYQVKEKKFTFCWGPIKNSNMLVFRDITMSRSITKVQIQRDNSLKIYMDARAIDDESWRCPTRPIPADAAQVKVYGRNQELISYDLFLGVIEHEIKMGYLDKTLNNQTWGTSQFHFTAGQLFDVIPILARRYEPEDAVTGECKATLRDLDFYALNKKTFGAKITYDCSLFVQRSRFSNFVLKLDYEFKTSIQDLFITLWIKSYSSTVDFYPYADYEIKDLSQAEAIVAKSLNRITTEGQDVFEAYYLYDSYKKSSDFVTEKPFARIYDRGYNFLTKETQNKGHKMKLFTENQKNLLTTDQ